MPASLFVTVRSSLVTHPRSVILGGSGGPLLGRLFPQRHGPTFTRRLVCDGRPRIAFIGPAASTTATMATQATYATGRGGWQT